MVSAVYNHETIVTPRYLHGHIARRGSKMMDQRRPRVLVLLPVQNAPFPKDAFVVLTWSG